MSSHWSARTRTTRLSWLLALAALVFAALAPLLQGAVPPQPLPTQRVNLKVLVVGPPQNPAIPGDEQADYNAWQAVLRREGVPFDARLTTQITSSLLSSGNTANYQAVIVATGGPFGSLATLNQYEATFGIRQFTISGDTFDPAVSRGFNGVASPPGIGDQFGQFGQLTSTGQSVFSYLKPTAQIPMDQFSQGFSVIPAPTFTPLVSGPGGGAYLGIYTDPIDLRQEMVFTVSSNENQIENQLLRHGILTWVTRGVYLGTQRNYFTMNIDDVFLPDGKWDPATKTTPTEDTPAACNPVPPALPPANCVDLRMTPSDVTDAIAFQSANNFRFDFAFNGVGLQEEAAPAPTGTALIANRGAFRWINHTFQHINLDSQGSGTINPEIDQNKDFAQNNGIVIDPTELVTGEHSGLGSYPNRPPLIQAMVTSLSTRTPPIAWIADDNSVQPNQRQVGSALTVPRYPSNVYYNVGSRADQLDEYNWIYRGCAPTPTPGCPPVIPASWAQYLDSEVGIMFRHIMGNDPRPHYAHQPNLMQNGVAQGILYGADGQGVLNVLFARYNQYFNVPLAQPTFAESGRLLSKANTFAGLWPSNAVNGYLQDGKVHVVNNTGGAVDVPITGTTATLEIYGGSQRSGWVRVNPGDTAYSPADPFNAAPPAAAGAAAIGATITASPGQWLSGANPGLLYSGRYQWQRCNVTICSNITGVVDANYTTGTIDRGFSIRVVEMAGNWVSSVSQAASNAILMPGPAPAPGTTPPTAPAPGNVINTITRLTLTNVTVSPRTFKAQKFVNVKGKKKSIGGTTIRWRLNAAAKVQIVVQKRTLVRVGKKRVVRWVRFGSIQRDGKAGRGSYLFTGRIINNKLIGPAQYRFVISASRNSPKLKTPAKIITFRFLRG